MADLERLKMSETDSVDDFAGKISGLASQSAALGENIEESKLVKKFLTGFQETRFGDIVGRIKAYEERVGEETKSEDQGKLMFSNSSNNRGGYNGFQGGNKGGYNRGGYNRGGYNRGGNTRGGYGRGDYGRGGYNRGGSDRGNYGESFGRGRGRGRSNGQNQE
ncbi:PREDICTED: glycine-rich RNA-binding protein 1-like [Camelina sativa]|uniref:Glycine-rich RNA-binding protein 1-like n=1 Tax=Camelina sativa TaxID=90675 RepID=A0ABM1QFC3_CAMSA|nr:PREDICTED: glycine-rich RNA-binding protein 1-like [Camelina sativa]